MSAPGMPPIPIQQFSNGLVPLQGVAAKHFDDSLEGLLIRAQEIRKSIEDFLIRVDSEQSTMNWPKALDNFGLLSGQISSLMSAIKGDKTPTLRNYPLIPLKLNPDQDPHLHTLTNGRVPTFSHAEAPDYLRTKPDPSVEHAEQQILNQIASAENSQNVMLQIQTFNKQCSTILARIHNSRANSKVEAVISRTTQATSSPQITLELFGMLNHGYGLKSPQQIG